MAIPKTGNVSLVAVRDDVGATGSFSMNRREAIDKLNWDSSDRSLTQYRGNVLGNQYMAGGATLSTYQKSSFRTSYAGSEIGEPSPANSLNVWPEEPRHTHYYSITSNPANSGDCWSENRHHGVLFGGGNVKVEFYTRQQGDGRFLWEKISLVACSDGFLQGNQNILLDFRITRLNWNLYKSGVLTVPSSKPYLSLIVYALALDGGQGYPGRTHYYTGPRVYLS
jgi:hypothetical protein